MVNSSTIFVKINFNFKFSQSLRLYKTIYVWIQVCSYSRVQTPPGAEPGFIVRGCWLSSNKIAINITKYMQTKPPCPVVWSFNIDSITYRSYRGCDCVVGLWITRLFAYKTRLYIVFLTFVYDLICKRCKSKKLLYTSTFLCTKH